jgi:hypothetical protein
MAQQWWEAAPVVSKAPRADQRGAVEFAAPATPMAPDEAARLGLAFKADARAEAAQEGRVAPAGYRFTADGRTLEPVPGGPADPNAKVRPLREGDAAKLVDDVTQVDALKRSLNSFQDDFAGNLAGDVENYAQGITGMGTPGQRDWWANFRATDNIIRNALFGASLTAGEKSAYQATTITPGMSPQEVKRNLERRLGIVEAAANRRVNRLRAGGYNEGEIDAIAGPVLEQPVETPQDSGPVVTAPGTTRAAAMGAVTPGEPVMTDEDMAAGRAIQEAWNATGKFEDVARVASQFGRTFGEEEAAFLKANEGKPVNINANATGTPTATQEAVGEFVATPGGEAVAAGAVGAANAASLGMLDELAPILGLDAERVQMAKDYLRNKAPVSSFAGEMVGALPAAAAMSSGASALLGGTRIASAAPMIGDVAFGSALAGGEAPEGQRLGAALTGGAVAGGAGALGRRLFGGGAGGAGGAGDGGMTPPGGPMGASGGRASVSAAATPDDLIRASKAAELGIDLMPFQASRSFKDMQRAHELSKNGEIGGPLRERFGRQQAAIMQKFDDFIEGTGSEVRENLAGQGAKLTTALEKMAANDKARVRTLYKQAEKSADANTPVPLNEPVGVTIGGDDVDTTLIEWLNSQPTGLTTSGITDSAKQLAARLGIAKIDPDTRDLVPAKATVKGMETLRREVSQIADGGDPNLIRQKVILKNLIDGHTEPHATGAYVKARNARRDVAVKYEEVSTIAQLLGTKRNTPERLIAAENVMERLIKGGTSVANIKALRKLVAGEGGDPQAWKEVQGATLEYLRGKAYGAGNNVDEFGNPVIQVASFRNAVADLDKSGKLDELLGFEKANAVRVMADTAQDMFTAPAGSINFSNTNSMWWNIADMLLNGAIFQIPLPAGVASNVLAPLKRAMKEAPLKKEVKQLIGEPTQ